MIRNFILNFTNFCIKNSCTKVLVPGNLFSTPLVLVFKPVAAAKPLASGIFLSIYQIFFSKLCLCVVFIDLREL